ncbi:hypothetical protein EWB00_002185 [Schistosoma japonicum]|uniref:Uncharacterized protein n=1 Tax=Schistosoma japonicum TaxID=6182 RepID=A0A4Z2DD04_SCHJA|nr:hypothetical protein EWB00_002185 [Schistosoma japonicum]
MLPTQITCSMNDVASGEIQKNNFPLDNPSTELLTPIEGSNETFRQRQSDVFSALASIEAAHLEVYKATKEERKAVRKAAWRHTVTAPENLAELKEHREISGGNEKSTVCQTQNSTFRKPIALPPSSHRRPNYVHRDPSKWTHYSLADIDEDADDHHNGAIAMALINELRESRNSATASTTTVQDETRHNNRILFRPTRGQKRSRLIINDENLPKTEIHLESLYTFDVDESQELTDNNLIPLSFHNENLINQPIFVNRRHKGQLRNRQQQLDHSIEYDASLDEQTTTIIVDSDSNDKIDDDLDGNSDELEENPEDDKTNDYLA